MRLPKDFVTTLLMMALTAAPAMADVVAVVSSRSAVTALSNSQIADIFLGKSARFPDGSPAVPFDQIEGSAIRDEFYGKVVGKTAAQIKVYWSRILFTGRGRPPPTVSDSIEMKRRITENRAAIGYIDRSLVDDSVRVVF